MSNLVKDILVAVWILLFSAIAALAYLNINTTTQNFNRVVTQLNKQSRDIQALGQLNQQTTQKFNRVATLLDSKRDK